MGENLGEINVKVESEGVDDTADEVQGVSDGEISGAEAGGGPGGDETADMLGNVSENTSETSGGMLAMAGGIGMAVGMLANLDGIKQMFSAFMKVLQTLFMPMALMLMQALGPLIRAMTKIMPKMRDVLDSKLGKVASGIGALAGGIIGGVIGGGPGAIIGAIFGSMIPIGVDMLMDHIFGKGTITKWDILDKFIPGAGDVGAAFGAEGASADVDEPTPLTPATGLMSIFSPLYGLGLAYENLRYGLSGNNNSQSNGGGSGQNNNTNVLVKLKGSVVDFLTADVEVPNIEELW